MQLDRRAFLRRVAVSGAVAWVAPTITTINASPAFATPAPPDEKVRICNERAARAAEEAAAAEYNRVYNACLTANPNQYFACDKVAQAAAQEKYVEVFADEFTQCMEEGNAP